jgi:predicted Fe-Mo cluster-binding NifX family protein
MKIAIPSNDKEMVSENFGRAGFFVIFDLENHTTEIINNEVNLNAEQGAGIQSASLLVKNGINAVLAPHVGPKAFEVLKSAKLTIFATTGKNMAVKDALEQYKAGILETMTEPRK